MREIKKKERKKERKKEIKKKTVWSVLQKWKKLGSFTLNCGKPDQVHLEVS